MKKLVYLFLNDNEKLTHELLQECDTSYLNEQIIDRILQVYQGVDMSITTYSFNDSFFKRARKMATWVGHLKTLLAVHKLTHCAGSTFVENFIKNKLPNYKDQRPKKQDDMRMMVHVWLVEQYQNYLTKLMYNYEDFKVLFSHSIDLYQRLSHENLSLLHLISKVQNILTSILKMEPLFEASLMQKPNLPIVRQGCYFILTDCYYFYTFITTNITSIIDDIFSLPSDEALFLYELYAENIQTTKKIKHFMLLINYLEDFDCKEPVYYNVIPENNKKIELYINNFKGKNFTGSTKRIDLGVPSDRVEVDKITRPLTDTQSSKRTNKKSYLRIDDPEDSDRMDTDTAPEKNIRDISKIILSVTTPSFNDQSKNPHKMVFQAPRIAETKRARGHNNHHSTETGLGKDEPVRSRRFSFTSDNQVESTNDGETISSSSLRRNIEMANIYKPLSEAAASKQSLRKMFTQGAKSANKDSYANVRINEHTPNLTPNESFSDSFITPHSGPKFNHNR